MQWLGKHVPAATDTNATMVQQERRSVFYVVRAEMFITGTVLGNQLVATVLSWKSGCEKMALCVMSGVCN
jgi:hypothetical protein